LDCVLEPTKQKVLDYLPKITNMNILNTDPVLNNVAGFSFHNKSKFDFEKLKPDPNNEHRTSSSSHIRASQRLEALSGV